METVAPHAGAWIETIFTSRTEGFPFSRTPHGCVIEVGRLETRGAIILAAGTKAVT